MEKRMETTFMMRLNRDYMRFSGLGVKVFRVFGI